MAVPLPQGLVSLEFLHLLARQRRKEQAVLQVTVDAVAGHAFADDGATLKSHRAQRLSLRRAVPLLDDVEVA